VKAPESERREVSGTPSHFFIKTTGIKEKKRSVTHRGGRELERVAEVAFHLHLRELAVDCITTEGEV
jgi:hypothetical protein